MEQFHIKNDKTSNYTGHAVAYCGKVISHEYHFIGVDHVVLSRLNGEYRDICPDCMKIILDTLNLKE